jgi:multisubunit Na+/H+ antiporter MnhB subunit
MTITFLFDASLAALVLGIAAWTIVARGCFGAVVGYIAYGLFLALVWVRLSAVDVALTEAAIGSGVTGVLLIGAVARLQATEATALAEQLGPAQRILAGALCGLVTLAIAAAMLSLPDPAPTLAPLAAENLPKTGLGNAVTGVLLAYRAFDTLLESVVLVLALAGVWSFALDRDWGGRPGPRRFPRSEGALRFLAQLLPPVGIIVGVHLVWTGANEPGGAFQGGTILAAMWIVVMIAGLADAPLASGRWPRIMLVGGPALFLAIGIAGFALADAFLAYPRGYAKPLILIIEAGLTLSIAVALALLAAGPPQRRPQS